MNASPATSGAPGPSAGSPPSPLSPRRCSMGEEAGPDSDTIRGQVRDKYRAVALDPGHAFGFHTGRALAARLGYDAHVVDALPDRAVESFARVSSPFSLRRLGRNAERRAVPRAGQLPRARRPSGMGAAWDRQDEGHRAGVAGHHRQREERAARLGDQHRRRQRPSQGSRGRQARARGDGASRHIASAGGGREPRCLPAEAGSRPAGSTRAAALPAGRTDRGVSRRP